MNKGMVLLGTLLVLFFLTSCTTGTVVPKAFPGSAEMFKVNDLGTVEVKGHDLNNQPMHWVFVDCPHWSGCYMRCQGPQKTCASIATKSDLKVSHINSNH
ncbi:MAG: hypothetical protein F3743_11835 [Nitrospinae bacterium]|nr:hypothetical protein [Nitrospinota bacterium]